MSSKIFLNAVSKTYFIVIFKFVKFELLFKNVSFGALTDCVLVSLQG